MTLSAGHARKGFSLVELLCVMAISAVLASLLAGPVLKALAKVKGWEWSDRAPIMMDKVAEQLRRYYAGRRRYPASTAEELYRRGAFEGETIRFLRSKKVEYFPFSSADPPEKLILRVRVAKQEFQTLFKTDLAPKTAE